MGRRGVAGGIRALLGLLERHRGALQYDFRQRFQSPLTIVGDGMDWAEAVNIVSILRADPSSMIAAAIEGWDHPVTREAAILMDLWDLEYAKAGAKKQERYRRPWAVKDGTRHGKARPMREAVEILNRFGHQLPVV